MWFRFALFGLAFVVCKSINLALYPCFDDIWLCFGLLQKKEMLSAVENIPQLQIYEMDQLNAEARLDGGDVLYTGILVSVE